MGVGAVAGTRLFTAPAGVISLSTVWTEVKDIASLGDIQQAFNKIAIESVGDGNMYEIKGTQNYPTFDITLNRNDTDPGQIALRAAANARNVLYNFRLQENDTDPLNTATVTITIAAPGVVTDTAHGLVAGNPVSFSTTGALPTGLVAGTTYYLKTVPDANSYTLAATAGGAAITTSGTQSGVHTRTTVPSATTTTWNGEVFGFGTSYGGVNNVKQVKTSISIRPSSVVYTLAVE
jgi:hypothetical protein